MTSPTAITIRSGKKLPHGQLIRDLAQFRYALRTFLRFSETAARDCGVTPQQHQLLLGVAGFTGRHCASISELAEFLQERNHSVIGLVNRAVENGLVRRTRDSFDRRVVLVSLTRHGEVLLARLAELHEAEARRIAALGAFRKGKTIATAQRNSSKMPVAKSTARSKLHRKESIRSRETAPSHLT